MQTGFRVWGLGYWGLNRRLAHKVLILLRLRRIKELGRAKGVFLLKPMTHGFPYYPPHTEGCLGLIKPNEGHLRGNPRGGGVVWRG